MEKKVASGAALSTLNAIRRVRGVRKISCKREEEESHRHAHRRFGWFQFHGSNSAIRFCGISAMRASKSASHACGSTSIELGRNRRAATTFSPVQIFEEHAPLHCS